MRNVINWILGRKNLLLKIEAQKNRIKELEEALNGVLVEFEKQKETIQSYSKKLKEESIRNAFLKASLNETE